VTPKFIGNDIYRRSHLGRTHPLSIPRVSSCIDLSRLLGWLDQNDYIECRPATRSELLRVHRADYLDVLERLEAGQRLSLEEKRRYNVGVNGNPIYAEILSRPATACGATLTAVRTVIDGGVVYSPAGGTHHGRPGHASGFCYLNDIVLGVLDLLDRGYTRIAYVDLDAHHCDGVQDAFHGDRRVLIVSVHEDGRWPYTGLLQDDGGGNAVNVPVPAGFHDDECAFLIGELIVPLLDAFEPELVMIQAGADALAEDPLSKLELSNNALWHAVPILARVAPRAIVVGGGGYNPWSVARCWTGIWASLRGAEIPDRLPHAAEQYLRAISWSRSAGRNPPTHWFTTLRDTPHRGAVRDPVRAAAAILRDDLARRHDKLWAASNDTPGEQAGVRIR
jgi:acetoin utilization protein AcuC